MRWNYGPYSNRHRLRHGSSNLPDITVARFCYIFTWLLVGALAVFAAWPATPVDAHAGYVRSEPAFHEHVRVAPKELSIWFSQELHADGNWVDVIDQQGESVQAGPAYVSPDDPKKLVTPLENLRPGSYLVNWHAVSLEDDHPADGSFVFTVGEAGASSRAAPEWQTWLALVLSVIAVAVSTIAFARSAKRQ